ncbi:MAG: PEP-CTERM sorting domain-containing protein [Candidatus Solibacter sp.]
MANISVSGFQNITDVVVAGNELVTANAVMAANLFQNLGGSPGAMLGSITFAGTMDFTFFGRTLANPLGTFNAQITNFDFMGTFNGHTIEARQNPSQASTGQTSVSALDADGRSFEITSFFDVFAELSIDGGPFVPGPPRHTELTAAPEPGSIGLAVFGLLGLAGVASRWRRSRSAQSPIASSN